MERWKDIIGYEDYYQISDKGNLRSKNRYVSSKNGSTALKIGRTKKAGITNGYKVALLSKYGIEKGFGVHKLVALHFVSGKTSKRNIVNHIDSNKLNNHYSNLEWCTQKENIAHSWKNGLQNPKNGENHHFSKLSDIQVNEIKKLFKNGIKRKDISANYNISYSSICRICKGTQRKKGLAIDINTIQK